MAKGTRGRRRMASRHCRATPYPLLTCREKKSTISIPKKDWEDITCSVCMEYPHNAVLLLCSSHDKGCRPYMCGTSSRYSNCLDQYKKAYTKVTISSPHDPPPLTATDTGPVLEPLSGWPVEKYGEVAALACPLCRGQVKGWTVVESAREFLNCKKRTCMHDKCSFIGAYKELKKHVKSEHPSTKPHDVDPDQEQKWRRLEREREREDVISTVTSSMPGGVVYGDYIIERNTYESDSEDEEGFDVEFERNPAGTDNGLVNVFLLFHAFGAGGNEAHFGRDDNDDSDDSNDDDGGDGRSMSFVNRFHRQGRVLLGRSGNRRQSREVDRSETQT
nr:hypothetical protein [Tanacetum cinerariifolium]